MRILCFFGWHDVALHFEAPEAKTNGLSIGIKVVCTRCQKEITNGGLNLSLGVPVVPGTPPPRFNFTHEQELDN